MAVAKIVHVCAVSGSAVLAVMTLAALLFWLLPLTLFVYIVDIAVVGMLLCSILAVIIQAGVRYPRLDSVARTIERGSTVEHPLLSAAIELGGKGYDESQHQLTGLVIRSALGQLSRFSVTPPSMISRRVGLLMLLLVFLLGGEIALLRPSVFAYWNIPFHSTRLFDIAVEPGTIRVPRNETVTLRCTPRSGSFPLCKLIIRNLENPGTKTMLLRYDSLGDFSYTVDSTRSSFTYTFSLGTVTSSAETVFVISPPLVNRFQATVIPPWYTHRKKRQLPEGQGNCSGYPGTKVSFSLEVSNPLKAAWYIDGADDSVALDIDGSTARGEVEFFRRQNYTFGLLDTFDQANESLPRFTIDIVPDESPSVHFIKPGFNTSIATTLIETLWIEAVDDLGVKTWGMHWFKNADRGEKTEFWEFPVAKANPALQRREIIWDTRQLQLYPGDTLFYWGFVRDTKPYRGGNTAVTDTFWFRMPTFEQIHKQVLEKNDATGRVLKSVRERQKDTERMLEEIVSSVEGDRPVNWETKQVMKDLASALEEQVDSLSRAMESIKEAVEQMKEEGVASEEIVEKMEEIKESIQELIDTYGDSLFFDLSEQDWEISGEEMKEVLERIESLLPDLNEQLDNTLAFLEALKEQQEIAGLAAQAERLAGEQQKLLTTEGENSEKMDRQENLIGDIERLKEQVENFSDSSLAGDIESMPGLDSALAAMQQSMKAGAMPESPVMNSMSAALMQMSEELSEMLSMNMMAQMQKERDLLLNMANDALSMAQWQERINEMQGSEAIEEIARSLQTLKQAVNTSREKLDSLSMVAPRALYGLMSGYEQAGKHVGQSMQSLEKSRRITEGAQTEVALNSLAEMLLQTAANMEKGMQQSMCGGGMMCGMRKLSGQQAAINAATASLLESLFSGTGQRQGGMEGQNESGGGGTSAEQARKEAQQAQEAVAEELERLAREYGQEAAEKGMQRRMEELEREARRLAEMLKNPKPELAERQDRFLARMLQSTLSIHRRDEGKEERVSRSAQMPFQRDVDTETGKEVFKDIDTFYRLRQRALDSPFPEEYRMSVKHYFDSLGVRFFEREWNP
jgi:hypothetical protein